MESISVSEASGVMLSRSRVPGVASSTPSRPRLLSPAGEVAGTALKIPAWAKL